MSIPFTGSYEVYHWRSDDPREQTRIGEFYWALRNTPPGEPLLHMHGWPRDDGSLAAVAWLDPPHAGDMIVARHAVAIFDDALDWLEDEHSAHGSDALSIVVLAGDVSREAALQRRGYTRGEGGNVRFWRSLDTLDPATQLPSGYALHTVASDADRERRVFVEMDGFGASGLTAAAWRSITARLPRYRPDLDLVAVAPDGSGASACTCWFDEETRCGEVEAVATATAHRRLGVCRAVIAEGLQRLRELGATQAVVETTSDNVPAIALYTSCGFEFFARDYAWLKDS